MIHAKQFFMKIRTDGLGPGGWHCPCCSPSPKNRPRYLRAIKKKERKMFSDLIRKDLAGD
jgi:hypothetical protein